MQIKKADGEKYKITFVNNKTKNNNSLQLDFIK